MEDCSKRSTGLSGAIGAGCFFWHGYGYNCQAARQKRNTMWEQLPSNKYERKAYNGGTRTQELKAPGCSRMSPLQISEFPPVNYSGVSVEIALNYGINILGERDTTDQGARPHCVFLAPYRFCNTIERHRVCPRERIAVCGSLAKRSGPRCSPQRPSRPGLRASGVCPAPPGIPRSRRS